MSDTVQNSPPSGGILSTRAMNTLRYSLMNVFILFGAVFMMLGGAWTYMGLIFSFILIGYVDELFGDISDREHMPPVWYCQTMLFATLPLLIFITLMTFNVTSPTGWAWLDVFPRLIGIDPDAARQSTQFHVWSQGALASLGMYYGAAGVNVAHELIHRTDKPFDKLVGRWLLAFTWDTGFAIEHVHGHHRYVGTEKDPATARRGEYIIAFVVRSTIGQWLSAKEFEDERLKRKGEPNNLFTNRFWRGQLMTLAIMGFYCAFLGWWGIPSFLMSGAIGKIYLEVVNYIEHYGLVRMPGTRVEARHSWDSHRRVSGGMFYNLMLHSNHHKIATRRFWELEQSPAEEAATLPRGYMTMILFAFLGPLFFNYINKHLGRWDRDLASPDEVAYLKAKGIYYGDLA
ncbi:MAG: alkane 1-monooxygenase [Hyphomicrobiales bacterium]|nr:MAG: alkane 1-monooxygenase [Hyphomicrobiales bacterium]